MLKFITSLTLLALLTGCLSPEERAKQREMQIQQDIAVCKSYGLKEGSEAFGNCRLQLDLERQRQFRDAYFYGGYGYHRHGPHVGTGVYF